MVRSLPKKKPAFRKGSWTPEEDTKLIAYIQRYGIWNWSQMPKFAGLKKSGKSCRLRWMNYLRPDLKHGNFTEEEEEIIISLYEKMGSRWSVIAKELPGRTDNEVKNYWHTRLKKRSMNNLVHRVKPQAVETFACKAIKENLQENNASLLNNAVEISSTTGHSNFHAQSNESGTGSSSTLDWGFGVNFESANLNTGLSGENFGDSQISWAQPLLMENSSMEDQLLGFVHSDFDFPLWSQELISPTSGFYSDACCDLLFNLWGEVDLSDHMPFNEEPIFQF